MFQPNSVIAGRYQVVRLVGQGGMSNLYLAYDRKYSNATVVVKEMTASYSDPKEQQMAVDLFHREAKLLASLNHRHIPKVFDYFQFTGKYYLSMEYIDGVDLAVKLDEKKGPLPEKQVLEWGEQIATVLFYLHKHDPPIVFRDVKPSNIMISSQGVKLIDFGIARHFDQAKKGDTMRIGSPGYAPPEQYAAQTDPRSDIYALGVTLHHALTGRDPTATSTPFLVPPARELNPNLAEATAAMLARATQLDPSDRYQSALEMKKDIKHILQRGNQSTRVVGAPPTPPPVSPAGTAPSQAQSGTPAQAASTPAATGTSTAAPAAAATGNAPATSGSPAQPQAGQPGQPAAPASAKPGAKKSSLGRLLLTACLLTVIGAGIAFAMAPSEVRNRYLSRAKDMVTSFLSEFHFKQNPEDRLRDTLLSGKPEALLPLFQSQDFKELSEEKQELFRLNLLAAGSANGRLRVIHLLVPEGRDSKDLWKTSAQALAAINGGGGLAGEFFAVVPQVYKPGNLDSTLRKLSTDEPNGPSQSFLALDGQDETLSESTPSDLLFLSSRNTGDRPSVPPLDEASLSYAELYKLELDSSSPPTVWGVPGERPPQALESKTPVSKLPAPDALKAMLEQAASAGGRVVLAASGELNLDKITSEGEVLLLAPTYDQLPSLGPNLKGEALVLSSPFDATLGTTTQLRPAAPLSLTQARLFDALVLAALKDGAPFDGLTIRRGSAGKLEPKSPTAYQWKDSWLPKLEERGKKK